MGAAGGSDSASPRYIMTRLSTITRCIFPEADDNVLNFLDDDGQSVEPEWYVPIIPTVLLNGCQGIGTGWSTNIPAFNPRDLVKGMKQLIKNGGTHVDEIMPWYNGWTGKLLPSSNPAKYLVEGLIEKVDEKTVLISELPIHKWTTDYKNNCTESGIAFDVTFEPDKLLQIEGEKGLINFFKLSGNCNLTNMMMFDPNMELGGSKIRKFLCAAEIMKRFYTIRYEFYGKRKEFMVNKLKKELKMLENRVRFIRAVINGELEIRDRPKADILHQLERDGYDLFSKEKKRKKRKRRKRRKKNLIYANYLLVTIIFYLCLFGV